MFSRFPAFNRPALLALGGLLLFGPGSAAAATCFLQTPEATLADYDAARGASGGLGFQVACDAPEDRYTLHLLATGGAVSGADLTGQLRGLSAPPLHFRLLNVFPELSGTRTLSGSRTFSYSLQAPAGQWSLSAGTYSGTLTLTVTFQ